MTAYQPPLLQAINLTAERGGRTLFAPCSLSLYPGKITLLRGTNGIGKSTLLRLLAGLSTAQSGEIKHFSNNQNLLYWGHAAGVKDELTARENLKLLAASTALNTTQIDDALKQCGLDKRRDVLAKRLSAGQRRRILLSRLLLATELVWLLDEPTAALDQDGLAILTDALNRHAQRGGTALIATHVALEGLAFAPQVLELKR